MQKKMLSYNCQNTVEMGFKMAFYLQQLVLVNYVQRRHIN